MRHKLEQVNFSCINEADRDEKTSTLSEDDRNKNSLIDELKNSTSFMNTHNIIAGLSQFDKWSAEQKEGLVLAAIDNQQVFWLLGDGDVSAFYGKLVEGLSGEDAEKIRAELNN